MTSDEMIQATFNAPLPSFFQARIYQYDNGVRTPLRFTKPTEERLFSDGGWLQAGGEGDSPLFAMDFTSKLNNRLTMNLSAHNHRGLLQRVGRSRNGYLGLYDYHTNTQAWKLEPLEWTGTEMLCYLRDFRDYRVVVSSEHTFIKNHKYYYLNTEGKSVSKFLVKQVVLPGLEGMSWLS
ncbi:hypothetical protein [Pseudomonas sp. RIT623]|uniref:hypothetical protein n=1 Tax=Pseudomonas sp. RIT623 TaxID=2559075 RepID=UPI00106FA128|nr:hypothetical protein [Pseudomonas sp. RIT623]TFF39056.1 hypothetical protein E3U47_14870 [Pseudomonas sp. RIT623]